MIYNTIVRNTFTLSDLKSYSGDHAKWYEMSNVHHMLKNVNIQSINNIYLHFELTNYVDLKDYYHSNIVFFSYDIGDKYYTLACRFDSSDEGEYMIINRFDSNGKELMIIEYDTLEQLKQDIPKLIDIYVKAHIDKETTELKKAVDIYNSLVNEV